MKQYFLAPAAVANQRLDVFLTAQLPLSRSIIQKACRAGKVTCDGIVCKANYRLSGGEEIIFDYTEEEYHLEPEPIPLDIIYEDEDILVVNKRRGMVVHPSQGHLSGTLAHALLAYTDGKLTGGDDPLRPGIVHRLDRCTSGLLAIAKTERGYESLAAQVLNREMTRTYLALVHGGPDADRGTINLPIGRDQRQRILRTVTPDGRPAVTHFTVVERMPHHSLLRCVLETGRTHQIRVHLAHIGCPLVQDPLYGKSRDHFPIKGQALHAAELILRRPADGEEIRCEAPLPKDLLRCIRIAREKRE